MLIKIALTSCAAALTLWVTAPAAAADSAQGSSRFAEPPPPPGGTPAPAPGAPEPRFRQGKGWFVGGSLGFGTVSYSSDSSSGETAAFFEARFGTMLGNRFALSIEYWSDGHRIEDEPDVAVTENSLALAATYWATPRFWLRAGLGAALLSAYFRGAAEQEFEGSSFLASGGYELWSHEKYSIDIAARFVSSSYEVEWETMHRAAFSLNLGANWY